MCQVCKGTKTQIVTILSLSHANPRQYRQSHFPCVWCHGTGLATGNKQDARPADVWCDCAVPTDWTSYEDNEHEGCLPKHHSHCDTCRRLAQIG